MIIELRYHLASLAAVFLALGLGILIGGTMLKTDALMESRRQIADRLERQLEQLRRDNEATQARLDRFQMDNNMQRDFARQILPCLVKGRLAGHQIAVIETNSYGFPDDLIATLQLAGAEVQSITTIMRGFDGSLNKGALAEKFGGKMLSEAQLNIRLAREIARGIIQNDNRRVLDDLMEANMVKISGRYGVPLNAVVLIGGSQEREMVKTESIDLPLIEYFLAKKIPVYGVEETNVLYSYMRDYQKKRISTVDNIDTVPGQVALVLAMSGRQGHYGIKSTAQKLLPPCDDPGGGDSAG